MLKYFVFLWGFVATVTATDYCGDVNCPLAKHIGCNFTGEWDKKCPKDAKLVEFTSELKEAIVTAHNVKRDLIASGKESKFKPACRMATMQWDDELAYIAEINRKMCLNGHDQCRNTDKFQWAGQNDYAIPAWPPANFNFAKELSDAVYSWYTEIERIRDHPEYLEKFSIDAPIIGHFTAMVADFSTHVGCAAATFTKKESDGNVWEYLSLVCNYARNNIPGYPVYCPCDKPAEHCVKKNPDYSNLCSTSEPYDVNDLSPTCAERLLKYKNTDN